MADHSWAMKGEFVRSCNCSGFCPCVLSCGEALPAEGACLGWVGFRIDAGHSGEVDLSGLNVGLLLESPGPMSRGNWTVGVYVDARASIYAEKSLSRIFSGKAGGSAARLSSHVGRFLGIERAQVTYETEGRVRSFRVANAIDGEIAPVSGREPDRDTVVNNAEYWLGPDVIVSHSKTSRLRAHGRNWDFSGRSAEIGKLDWRGP